MIHTMGVAGQVRSTALAIQMHLAASGHVWGLVLNVDATIAALAFTLISAGAGAGGVFRAIRGHTISGIALIVVGVLGLAVLTGSAILGGPVAHGLNQMGA